MSKKLAVFVEGFTEQEFTIRLLTELAGKRGIDFEIQEQYAGTLSFVELRSLQPTEQHSQPIHVLVANCRTDNQVKSQIKDNYKSLSSQGYTLVVGLRDVYPLAHNEIQDLEDALLIGLPVGDLPIHLHLAIMEIEAWFLEEITHFPRIDPDIVPEVLVASGFDHNSFRAHTLSHPTEILDTIYKTVGKRYAKKTRQIQRTVDALSYEELYVNTRHKAPSLEKFITSLEVGLFSTA